MNKLKRDVGCYFCNEFESLCLDWHHLDPSQKKYNVNRALHIPVKKIVSELKKCECVCANCHRRLHNNLVEKPTKIRPRLERLLLEVETQLHHQRSSAV